MYPGTVNQPWNVPQAEDSDEDKCFLCLKAKDQEQDKPWVIFSESSLHGLKYIGNPKKTNGERLIWAIGVLVGFGVSVYLINDAVVKPLLASPVVMAFQAEEKTIDQISFPAFTICNSNKLRESHLMSLIGTLAFERVALALAPSLNESEEFMKNTNLREKALRLLFNHCSMSSSFSEFYENTSFQEHLESAKLSDEISNGSESSGLWRFTNKVYHRCNETIVLCMWDNERVPCDTVFFSVQTEFEHCCIFNGMPQTMLRKTSTFRNDWAYRQMDMATKKAWRDWNNDEDMVIDKKKLASSKYKQIPKRQRKAGLTSGLSILLNVEEKEHWTPCRVQEGVGFRAQVHSLIDNPHIADFGKAIEANQETFVRVQAVVTIPDEDVKSLPLHQRQCYFFNDYTLAAFKFYTQKNCFDECVMNKTIQVCKCVRFFMPRTAHAHLCHTHQEFECLKELKKNLTSTSLNKECPQCLPSCTQIAYVAETDGLPLRDDVDLWNTNTNPKLVDSSWANESLAIVHVFFARDTIETRTRKSLYGYEEILANAGGLLGVALGFSMIALIEPIYHLIKQFCSKSKVAERERAKVVKKANEKRETKPKGAKKKVQFSPTKVLVNPKDFMRWSDAYLSDPELRESCPKYQNT